MAIPLLHAQDQAEIAVVEMMLEAYQMQMEKIHNKVKVGSPFFVDRARGVAQELEYLYRCRLSFSLSLRGWIKQSCNPPCLESWPVSVYLFYQDKR
jgi:hypothetical protein